MENAQKKWERRRERAMRGTGISLVIPDEAFCGITFGSLMYFAYI